MALLESILRRFGYIKLTRFGLALTGDGRVIDVATGAFLGGAEPLLPAALPASFSPSPSPSARKGPPPIPSARRAPRPRAPSPIIEALPLAPPNDSTPFTRPDTADEEAAWQRKVAEARSRATREEREAREWEEKLAAARRIETDPPVAAPAPAPAPAPAVDDEERAWQLALARARTRTTEAAAPIPRPKRTPSSSAPPPMTGVEPARIAAPSPSPATRNPSVAPPRGRAPRRPIGRPPGVPSGAPPRARRLDAGRPPGMLAPQFERARNKLAAG